MPHRRRCCAVLHPPQQLVKPGSLCTVRSTFLQSLGPYLPLFSGTSNAGRTGARKTGGPDRHIATNMSAVNWSRPRAADIELGTGIPRDDDASDDYKGTMRTVGFERGGHKDGIMITTDTVTK